MKRRAFECLPYLKPAAQTDVILSSARGEFLGFKNITIRSLLFDLLMLSLLISKSFLIDSSLTNIDDGIHTNEWI